MAHLTFMYWGRRGAVTQLAREIAAATAVRTDIAATMSISRQNESFDSFSDVGPRLHVVETFASPRAALTASLKIPQTQKTFIERLKADRTQAVIDLMPHVWSPFMAPKIRAAGVAYLPIVHDPEPHRGDPTGLFNAFALRALPHANRIICLSASVRDRLVASRRVDAEKVVALFHPNYAYGAPTLRTAPQHGERWRLLFLGRIMAYKGLGLFIDMAEDLRRRGAPIDIGVFGEGPLAELRPRLEALGAEIVNRWLSEAEIADALRRYHVAVLSHTNASQSGVIAAAHGADMPVIATPVGGLTDQIVDGETGLLAKRVDGGGLADAVARLIAEPALYTNLVGGVANEQSSRSVDAFVTQLADLAAAADH